MTMHIPTLTPACHTTGEATPRTPWAHDQGASCGNAAKPEVYERTLAHTPGCAGCSRAWRALDIHAGVTQVFPVIKTRIAS